MASPTEVLLGFMKEMNAWERQCAYREQECLRGAMSFEDASRIGEQDYMRIFDQYCAKTKATPREFHYSEPPDYDPDNEFIGKVRKPSHGIAEIDAMQNYGHRESRVFTLSMEDGQWKIVKQQIRLSDGRLMDMYL